MLDSILSLLPHSLKKIIANLPNSIRTKLEEIRIREERPLEISWAGDYSFVTKESGLVRDPLGAYIPTSEECAILLELLTNHSVYSFEEELRRGFITIAGGHRVGLAGRTVLEAGRVRTIRDVSSFNIRVAREIVGVGKIILPHLIDPIERRIHNTLIVSPPQQGKTTLLRDLARTISAGDKTALQGIPRGLKVGVVDERSEIAASVKGVPKFDLGPRTDVLDGCPKAEGMMMMIRSLSPELIVVDEIGRPEDAEALHEALHGGISVIATAHGYGMADIKLRPVLRELIAEKLFTRYVVLSLRRGIERSFQIYDGEGQLVP
ncbi:stage III sporulation protein AA [Paenibacillus albiflavus]|uniref:Stage III sporulation protein AA n=1 Tax=Paenibacillus albiflavus TaxID=2545760 RepID=A0A4R4EBZ5_9BACL|nr:stage III sporulation protein AA [Paenibacillus albiflavus]TCZ77446.1 stage III sporulation protein AA [Paenibacillus albiflavus]